MPERHSRSGIDGNGLFLLMQVSSGSVPIAMVGEEAAHVANRCFEARPEALAPQERHRLMAIDRVDVRDRALFAVGDAVEPFGRDARPRIDGILKVLEGIGRLPLRPTHWHL